MVLKNNSIKKEVVFTSWYHVKLYKGAILLFKNGTTLHLLLNNNTGCSPLPCMGKLLSVPFAFFCVVRRGFNDIVSFPLRGKGGLPFFICLYVFRPTGGSHDHYFRIRQSFLS